MRDAGGITGEDSPLPRRGGNPLAKTPDQPRASSRAMMVLWISLVPS